MSEKTIIVYNQVADNNLADLFTKIISSAKIRFLLEKFNY